MSLFRNHKLHFLFFLLMLNENLNLSAIFEKHKYTLIRPLSLKSQPRTFLVDSLYYHTEFVIKVEENEESFKNQLDVLSHIDHPNVIKIYDYFNEDNLYFLVLEFCSQGNLETLLKEKSTINEEMRNNIIIQLLDGLSYMHSLKFAHLNIQPSNILVDEYSRIKLSGFENAGSYPSNTSTNFKGSNEFMSPEIANHQPFDPFQADVWEAAVTIYYIICGFVPSPTTSKHERFKLPETIPDNIKTILNEALIEDPAKRISASQMLSTVKPKLQRMQSEKKHKSGVNPYRLSTPMHSGSPGYSFNFARCSLPSVIRH